MRAGPTSLSVPLEVLLLEGEPRARGLAHGEQMRAKVQEHLARFRDWAAHASGQDPDHFIRLLTSGQGFRTTVERLCPELLEETRGIADGARIEFEQAFALQLMDEAWWLAEQLKVDTKRLEHCTSVGWRSQDGSAAGVAQNMDLPDYFSGLELMLRLRHDDEEVLLLSAAGLIGLTGMNRHGVGICCNSLPQLDHREDGVPVAFVVRQVLRHPTAAEAKAHLNRTPHATAQNYVVSDPDLLFDLECSANSTELLKAQREGVVFHTNHPLVSADSQMYETRFSSDERAKRDGEGSSTRRRYDFVDGRVGTAGRADVPFVKALLGSSEAPVCVPNRADGSSMTLASIIMESTPAPRVHVSGSPATAQIYSTHRFGGRGRNSTTISDRKVRA
ncbi:MAG: C45 family autoproteolytic acyltransferase/hydrolase [Candidatus Dormibacteria bacterium]